MIVLSGPGRAVRPCGVTLPSSLARLSLSHKSMTTIYQTAVPSASSEPNSGFDAIQPVFNVYEAYQRALANEEVSPISSDQLSRAVFSSKDPDISPSSGHSISHGARHTF
jgi:hypothetical protein